MKNKITTLEKQLADSKKRTAEIEKQLAAEQARNKPKNIMDIVISYETACKYKKVKPTLSYEKPGVRTLVEIAHARLMFTFSVLNEGHKFKMDRIERRYYPWFINDPSSPSGLVFNLTFYVLDDAAAASAAHLSLKTHELAQHTGTAPGILADWAKFIFGK